MSQKDSQLSERLEKLLQGEEAKSRLSKRDGEEVEELSRLLETAGEVTKYAGAVEPRREFVTRIQANLAAACARKYDSRKTKRAKLLETTGRWAASGGIALIMTVFTSTGGFVLAEAASRNAAPGESLYQVKLATERMKATFTPADTQNSIPTVNPAESANGIVKATSEAEAADAATAAKGLDNNFTSVGNIQAPVDSASNPGKSAQAPGQQPAPPVDASAASVNNPGKSGQAPGQQPATPADTQPPADSNPGKSGQAPGQQSTPPGAANPGGANSAKPTVTPGQQPPAANAKVPAKGNPAR